MTSAAPFRTTTLTASADEIRRRNEEGGYGRARAHEETEAALARIWQASSANERRMRSWLLHPDERVPLSLMAQPLFRDSVLTVRDGGDRKSGFVLSRAMVDDLEAHANALAGNAMLWTPLLDGVASLPCAPGAQKAQFERRVSDLRAWVEALTDPRPALDLLEFSYPEVQSLPALAVRNLDDSYISALLERRPDLAKTLLKNPSLSTPNVHAVAAWAMAAIGDPRSPHSQDATEVLAACDQLTALHPDAVEELRQIAREGRPHAVAERAQVALIQLSRSATREILEEVYELGGPGSVCVYFIAKHPIAGTELLRRMALDAAAYPDQQAQALGRPLDRWEQDGAKHTRHNVMRLMVEHGEAMADDLIRHAVCEHLPHHDLARHGAHFPPTEFRAAFRRVAEESGRGEIFLRNMLRDATDEQLAAMDKDDLDLLKDWFRGVRPGDLARVPVARRDWEVQTWILASRDAEAIARLFEGASGTEARQILDLQLQRHGQGTREVLAFPVCRAAVVQGLTGQAARDYFLRLSEVDPMAGLWLIEASDAIRDVVQKEDLMPMLRSSEAQVRQRAITAMGSLRRPAPAQERSRTP